MTKTFNEENLQKYLGKEVVIKTGNAVYNATICGFSKYIVNFYYIEDGFAVNRATNYSSIVDVTEKQ